MLPQQRQRGGKAHHEQDVKQAQDPGDLMVATKAADDGGQGHKTAVGIERGDGHLAEHHAKIQQRRHRPARPHADDICHLMPGELAAGQGGHKHTENHRYL